MPLELLAATTSIRKAPRFCERGPSRSVEPVIPEGIGGHRRTSSMTHPSDPGKHPDPILLERFMRNEVEGAERRWIVRHLIAGCSRCVAVTSRLWSLGDPPAAAAPPATPAPPPTRENGAPRSIEPGPPGASAAGAKEAYGDLFDRLADVGRRIEAERARAPGAAGGAAAQPAAGPGCPAGQARLPHARGVRVVARPQPRRRPRRSGGGAAGGGPGGGGRRGARSRGLRRHRRAGPAGAGLGAPRAGPPSRRGPRRRRVGAGGRR